MDIVEEMRGFEIDHEPDGWPAVRMRQISALCDEIERLRTGDTCARQCEGTAYRIELRRLKRDLLAVLPANWQEDEDWARLIEAHRLTPNAELTGD